MGKPTGFLVVEPISLSHLKVDRRFRVHDGVLTVLDDTHVSRRPVCDLVGAWLYAGGGCLGTKGRFAVMCQVLLVAQRRQEGQDPPRRIEQLEMLRAWARWTATAYSHPLRG